MVRAALVRGTLIALGGGALFVAGAAVWLPFSDSRSSGDADSGRGATATAVEGRPWRCSPKAFECIVHVLDETTAANGPRAALRILALAERAHAIDPAADPHQLAHLVGRRTAEIFGVNGQAFNRCPVTFNYGCVHGFFEYALGRAADPAQAAVLICGSMASTTETSRTSCYHGVGHGVMMASAYNVSRALQTCDTFPGWAAQDGCWQGVFMENVNAGMNDRAPRRDFSATDPLAPCTAVDDKYKHECFINQGGALMHRFDLDLAESTRACLRAPRGYVSACAQSLGLMVTNPAWQATVEPPLRASGLLNRAWELCLRFASALKADCVIAGQDNLANFDQLDLTRSRRFCALVGRYRRLCAREVGVNVRRRTDDVRLTRRLCATLDRYERTCLAGARGAAVNATAPPVPRVTTKLLASPAAPKGSLEVRMGNDAYSPRTVTIRRGQTVTFVNVSREDWWPASNPHPVHTDYSGFDSGRPVTPGASWSFRFDRRGRHEYHNHLKPWIRGTIVVR